MLRVTFYSYKGGVGRTLCLLNVAAVLAQHGRRVVAVDLDLEAPGFGLSSLTAKPQDCLGASDLLLGRQERADIDFARCHYPILRDTCGDNFNLVPAGSRVDELIRRLPDFYADPEDDDSYLFEWLMARIGADLQPDYLFLDSRTGRADISAVCTVELPDVLVAVSGLNEQNRRGMGSMLTEIFQHPARQESVAAVLAISPVPDAASLGVPSIDALFSDPLQSPTADDVEHQRRSNLLLDALYRVQSELMPTVKQWFESARGYFPRADQSDLYHELPYDASVPLTEEYQLAHPSPLQRAYERLAHTLTRMHRRDDILEVSGHRSPPLVYDHERD